jgi:hypothetical protein
MACTTFFAVHFASVSHSQFYANGANPTTVRSISVDLADDAKEGCWTNLVEAKRYAEDKMVLRGYNVVPSGGDYEFVVSVTAFRTSQGDCVGSVGVQIYASSQREEIFGFHEIGDSGGVAIVGTNVNNFVLEIIQSITEKM